MEYLSLPSQVVDVLALCIPADDWPAYRVSSLSESRTQGPTGSALAYPGQLAAARALGCPG